MSEVVNWGRYFDEKLKRERDLHKKAGYNSIKSLKLRLDPVSEILNECNVNSYVLDAGCGVGIFLNLLRKKGFRKIVGIDLSVNAIKESRRMCECDSVIGDILKLPFKDNIFDIILCIEVLIHIADIRPVFSEFKRVLKKEGRLIIINANPNRIFIKSKPSSLILRGKEEIRYALEMKEFSIKREIDLPIPVIGSKFLFELFRKLRIPLDLCHSFLIEAIKER